MKDNDVFCLLFTVTGSVLVRMFFQSKMSNPMPYIFRLEMLENDMYFGVVHTSMAYIWEYLPAPHWRNVTLPDLCFRGCPDLLTQSTETHALLQVTRSNDVVNLWDETTKSENQPQPSQQTQLQYQGHQQKTLFDSRNNCASFHISSDHGETILLFMGIESMPSWLGTILMQTIACSSLSEK